MLKRITNLFKKPSAQQLAVVELEESYRQLLIHQSSSEYHSKMAEYYSGIHHRLDKFTHQQRTN